MPKNRPDYDPTKLKNRKLRFVPRHYKHIPPSGKIYKQRMLKTHILIFSYSKDIPYLEYCLKSIRKFCSPKFSGVTVMVPSQERVLFNHFAEQFNISLFDYPAPDDRRLWHIAHQGQKCRADVWCPRQTDLVLFCDSDCIFTEPVEPDEYMVNLKPRLLIQSYASLPQVPWKQPTEEIMGMECPYETMRLHPAVHWVGMLPTLRSYVEALHPMPVKRPSEFMEYILTRKADYPWGISDFNLMGSFVLAVEAWKAQYHIVDVEKEPWPHSKLTQFWSHGGLDVPQQTPNGVNLTPREVFTQLGL